MAFITELISTEDQKLIGFDHLRDPIGRPLYPYLWTVDKGREMFLLHTYRGGEDSYHLLWFIFDVKGSRLLLQLSCKAEQTDGVAVHRWSLPQPFVCCAGLKLSAEEVLVALKEALFSWTNRLGPVHQVFDF